MNKPKITFLMLTFNATRFIRASVESVLSQSEKDIRLIIRNNASTDGTGEICKAYAKRDSRVTYVENKAPYISDEGFTMSQREWWPEIDGEYAAIIDHDDILDKDFAKKMYAAAEQYQADIVVCGNNFFVDGTNKITGNRFAPALYTNDISCVAKRISEYYGVFRTLWAKIYRIDFYNRYYDEAFDIPGNLRLSVDTYFVFTLLEHCRSFVCIEDILYKYRISSGSQFNSKVPEIYRINEADALFEKAFEFLDKNGVRDNLNISFLYNVHWGHMVDLINIVMKTDLMSVNEKINFIQEILKNKRLQKYAESNINAFLNSIFDFISDMLNKNGTGGGQLHSFYIYRFYAVIRISNDQNNALLYHTMLSAVMDSENVNHIGVSLLKKKWGAMSEGESYFMKTSIKEKLFSFSNLPHLRRILARPINPEAFKKGEEELVNAVEEEEWELVAQLVSEFNSSYPIDEYATYYRLYLASLLQEWEFANEQAYISKVFWPDSTDIMELCQFIRNEYSCSNHL